MCLTPNFTYVNKGPIPLKVTVPCRDCWRCASNRVNDYVGRSLCEAAYSDWTCVLTLTYAPRDDLADKVLTPKHFQTFIRSLRKRGHKIRYLCVGEYGDLKGRAHFHAILFGKGKPLDIPNMVNTHIPAWPHGHVFADWDADEKALRYACKYLLKNEKGKYWFTISKKPSLGSEFFKDRAERFCELGVLPRSFEYLPPNGHRNRPYLVTGATRREFIAHLMDVWTENRPLDRKRITEWVLTGIEKVEKYQHIRECNAAPLEYEVLQFEEEIAERYLTDRQVNRYLSETAAISEY